MVPAESVMVQNIRASCNNKPRNVFALCNNLNFHPPTHWQSEQGEMEKHKTQSYSHIVTGNSYSLAHPNLCTFTNGVNRAVSCKTSHYGVLDEETVGSV